MIINKNKIYSEFEIRDDMSHDAFEYFKDRAIDEVTTRYINEIKNSDKYEPSIFNKKIAYEIHEERYGKSNMIIERIVLEPISVNTVEYTPKFDPFSPPKKYNFKERLQILIKGRIKK